MVHVEYLNNREEWLKARADRIGGSDAASVIGLNPYKSNVQLFREKTGKEFPKDVGNETAVRYGVRAEPLLRELFRLDHPDLILRYQEDNIWTNDDLPFAHASLDGWFTENDIVTGVLEIKTATIQNAKQDRDWINHIPNNYYCQVLWYMMVTGAQFAYVQALLRWERNKTLYREEVKCYKIERCPHLEEEIQFLSDSGSKFWEQMKTGEEPPLILPKV